MDVICVNRQVVADSDLRLDPRFYREQPHYDHSHRGGPTRRVSLEDMTYKIQDGFRAPRVPQGVKILQMKDHDLCDIDSSLADYVKPARDMPLVELDDVLLTRTGENFRAAVVRPDVAGWTTIAPELTILRLHEGVLPEYLAVMLSTQTLSKQFLAMSYQAHKHTPSRLRLKYIRQSPMVVASLAVQQDISVLYRKAEDRLSGPRRYIRDLVNEVQNEVRGPQLHQTPRVVQLNKSKLGHRWDVSGVRGGIFRESLKKHTVMKRLVEMGTLQPMSRQMFAKDQQCFTIGASDVNAATLMVEGGAVKKFDELSSRFRQPLQVGDVLLCIAGSAQQAIYLDQELDVPSGLPILGSLSFAVIEFPETPRYFTLALTLGVVRQQLEAMSSRNSSQTIINKHDLGDLMVPVLGLKRRGEIDARIERAFKQRRSGLKLRSSLLEMAEEIALTALGQSR